VDKNEPVESLDGTPLDPIVFNRLFNSIDTYAELPAMLERVTFDVSKSDFDSLKEHSIAYHIAGITDLVYGSLKALKRLEQEVKILDMDLDNEMEYKDLERYDALKSALIGLSHE
jgi:hypothetical protein